MKIKALLSIALSLALICSGTSVWAAVSGNCANCHTMHNSESGGTVTPDENGPNEKLLNADCVGCHSDGSNTGDSTGLTNNAPSVMTDAGGTSLAGGDFYWEGKGGSAHNVEDISSFTGQGDPPGYNASLDGAVGDATGWSNNNLTCGGTYGCHGPHNADDGLTDISGSHHGTGTVANDYRFLAGIRGIGDNDYEFEVSTDRNVYHGQSRTKLDTDEDTSTISYFCATCHGNYHTETGADPNVIEGGAATDGKSWLRHPSDYDLADTDDGSEYRAYTYTTEAPVAADLTVKEYTSSTNHDNDISLGGDSPNSDSAIVTCISCHRAHGSPNTYLLRWDYDAMSAGNADADDQGTGCFACHTTKDGS